MPWYTNSVNSLSTSKFCTFETCMSHFVALVSEPNGSYGMCDLLYFCFHWYFCLVAKVFISIEFAGSASSTTTSTASTSSPKSKSLYNQVATVILVQTCITQCCHSATHIPLKCVACAHDRHRDYPMHACWRCMHMAITHAGWSHEIRHSGLKRSRIRGRGLGPR